MGLGVLLSSAYVQCDYHPCNIGVYYTGHVLVFIITTRYILAIHSFTEKLSKPNIHWSKSQEEEDATQTCRDSDRPRARSLFGFFAQT